MVGNKIGLGSISCYARLLSIEWYVFDQHLLSHITVSLDPRSQYKHFKLGDLAFLREGLQHKQLNPVFLIAFFLSHAFSIICCLTSKWKTSHHGKLCSAELTIAMELRRRHKQRVNI